MHYTLWYTAITKYNMNLIYKQYGVSTETYYIDAKISITIIMDIYIYIYRICSVCM